MADAKKYSLRESQSIGDLAFDNFSFSGSDGIMLSTNTYLTLGIAAVFLSEGESVLATGVLAASNIASLNYSVYADQLVRNKFEAAGIELDSDEPSYVRARFTAADSIEDLRESLIGFNADDPVLIGGRATTVGELVTQTYDAPDLVPRTIGPAMMWRLFEKMISVAKEIAAEFKAAKTAVQKSFKAINGPQDKVRGQGRGL